MNRFRFVIFCEYINNMQRNSQKENSLAPYLCLGSKGYKFLHYTDQGGSICVSCSAILCMLVHNANLSRGTSFYIPGPLPGRKAEKNRVIFFFSFSLFRYLFFYLFYHCRLLWKELFYWNDDPLPIKPIGNSIPVYTIRGPGWEVLHKYGYVPPRRVWFSAVFAHYGLKLSMIFEEATALNKLIYLFNSKQLQMDTKERKINEIYHSNRV